MTPRESIERYIDFFETIEPDRLDRLRELCASEIRFIDPFNDLQGIEAVIALFQKMYDDIDEPAFQVDHWSQDDNKAYLRWTFTGRTRGAKTGFTILGVSLIELDAEARVILHHDFWDPAQAIYEKMPLLGTVLRLIRRRLGLRKA